MTSPARAERTAFSLDAVGRYLCNGLDEALRSADPEGRRPAGGSQRDARPFDTVVLGGGTFGAALAARLFDADQAHRHRILVLEGGPLLLLEHVQDLPAIGLGVAGATSIADLRRAGRDREAREEVWGLAWHSSTPFPGLAYCVGGRSLYWGGWSPRMIDSEMATDAGAKSPWPKSVVDELEQRYFAEASEQIGVDATNDFISGQLQNALRQRLFHGLHTSGVTDALALSTLPDHPSVIALGPNPTRRKLLDVLGLTASVSTTLSDVDLRNIAKLEAPLAVQARTISGLFPFNKFSAVPLLIQAARAAWRESANDDVKKRLMVVPNCHVTRLRTSRDAAGLRVSAIETNQGVVNLPPDGRVIVALGTIESARLVLLALEGQPVASRAGQNLIAHLRSNLTIRIPRTALGALDPGVRALQAAALFLKGRHRHGDGTFGHFHLQITAAGLGPLGSDSELELFKKIPDIDTFERFQHANDSHVVITIRGIGEMEPRVAGNTVELDRELDEFGARRALVSIAASPKDLALWQVMDQAADDVARIFAGNGSFETLAKNRDGLGTTHHEAGTLCMGDGGAASSVADPDGRLHDLGNVYAVGPATFPSTGSPNPMLTGIALSRRLANHLVPPPAPYQPTDGCTALFDGITLDAWRMSTIRNQPGRGDPGRFLVVDGALESVTGTDIGLFWCKTPMPADFVLRLEWLRWQDDANSGVFLRFPDPEGQGYDNTAYVAVDRGFEVQIDERGAPDGLDVHTTGAIYRGDGRRDGETLSLRPALPVGEWNEFEIRVTGQNYQVLLNGAQVCSFDNPYPERGRPSTPAVPTFIGLQTHTGRVAFRKIRFAPL